MKTTEKFGLTTYNTTDDKAKSNKEVIDSLESNFNILDNKAAKIINIPLIEDEQGNYSTNMSWDEIEFGIEERDLLYVDIHDSLLPLMLCDVSEKGYNLLFGYTNIVDGTISTRAVECTYFNDEKVMEWRDIDRDLPIGPQIPAITADAEGKCLGVKNGKLVFAAVGDFNLY